MGTIRTRAASRRFSSIPLVWELGRDAALVQAFRDPQGDVGRQVVSELFDAFAVERHDTEVGCHEVGTQLEEGLGGLFDARIFAREACDEDGGFAVGVEFEV